MNFIYAPEIISENILPLPPITIDFAIHPGEMKPTVYDIPVMVEDPLDLFTSRLRSSTNPHNPEFVQKLKEIAQLDSDIALVVQAMSSSKGYIAFMREFAEDPIEFFKRWVSSQNADKAVLLAEEKPWGGEWKKGGEDSIWTSQAARDGVTVMLARPKQ
jgi:SWI/SNF-related matrix-associated actin-dependent regulator of chromatin subfamily D